MNRDDIYGLIDEERARQNEKWGFAHPVSNPVWVMVMAEELGEVARAAHDMKYAIPIKRGLYWEKLRAELVQVAACAVWWLEELGE
jgi:NTP pyrophosphatase (non-canonical NTP hydrolase)